jgi:signal transduction histidine kinase
MSVFRPSLHRRIALALLTTSVLGYAVFTIAWGIFGSSWAFFVDHEGNSDCQLAAPFSVKQCVGYTSVQIYVEDLILVVALAALTWGCWRAAGLLLRPLAQMAEMVSRLGPQNLGERIGKTGAADPLQNLAGAFDDALDRLAAGYESQRRFAANASHELRTPLAVQRLLTEVAMDAPNASDDLHRLGIHLLRTNERNEKLIEGLLVLAESDRGLPGKVPVRLDKLAGTALDAHRELAGQHDIRLRHSLGERIVHGDPVLLERLIANLVVNAITYNEPRGWVEIVVADDPALTVRNTGQKIPAEAVSSLFEPFRRLVPDRTSNGGGVGLGLSIVRSIATAHDGTIHARPRTEGGLTVEIELR